MSKSKFLLPIIALLSVSACSSNDAVTSSIFPNQSINSDPVFVDHRLNNPNKVFNSEPQSLDEDYVASLNEFALDFYNVISNNQNSVFSPLSVATCYSMLYDGALAETKAELEAMLHYSDALSHLEEIQKMLLNNAISDPENDTYLDISQSLWIHDDFKEEISASYLKKMEDYYFAEAYQGKLETTEMHTLLADYINAKTNDFLKVKADDFKDYEGVLWLLNTIYLKSKWLNAFPKENNSQLIFHSLNGDTNRADFMNASFESHYYKADNYMISTIPYYHNLNFSVLLPNENVDASKVLNDKAAIGALLNYYNTRNHIGAEISYSIPQFKIQKSYELPGIMKQLGVIKAFDDDLANLMGLVDVAPKGNLYVARSKHEAGIEVNNEGTEAAAYTIIEVDEKAAAMPPETTVKFVCDRPFTYLISTKEGLPLFMGTVNNL